MSPGDCGAAHGISDWEFSAEWEIISERRWRPSVALLGTVKLAQPQPLGSGFTDYDLGVIINKEFVDFTIDFDAIYTYVGTPSGQPPDRNVEFASSIEYHLNHVWDVEAEVVWDSNGGAAGSGAPAVEQRQFMVGFAQHITREIRLEEGYTRQSDGTQQLLAGIEYSFGGTD